MKVVVSEQVLARLGELQPDQRGQVRRALHDLAKGSGETKELAGVLAGFHRLRVGRYRLVYRYAAAPRRAGNRTAIALLAN